MNRKHPFKNMKDDITVEQLKEYLHYDPLTGIFTRKILRGGQIPGKIAGNVDKKGYRHIAINHKYYKAARLAYLYMTGKWPEGLIDHIDRNPSNDRWGNLRIADKSQNMANSKRIKKDSGLPKGVTKNGKRFQANFYKDHKNYYVGTFDTVEEAKYEYDKLYQKIYGQYAYLGE